MSDFVTWPTLGTMAGAVAMVTVITQFIKAPLDKVWKIPTRYVAYLLSLIILLGAQGAAGTLTWETAGLSALNAVLVALSAMGAYQTTFSNLDNRKKCSR